MSNGHHWIQGPENGSVRNRRGLLRTSWGRGGGGCGPLWAPFCCLPAGLAALVASERSSGASFGRQLPAHGTPGSPIEPICGNSSNKGNDFRRAPLCNNWCPSVPLGPSKAPQGPPRGAQKCPPRDPPGSPRDPWGPFSRDVLWVNPILGALFPLFDFAKITPAPRRECTC